MRKAIRGISVGTGLVTALAVLTACGAPVILAPDQVRTALPSKASAMQGWEGDDVKVLVGEEALEICEDDTEANCGGLSSVGGTEWDRAEGVSESESQQEVAFGIYSFQTPEDAQAAMKSLVAEERKKAGAKLRVLEVSTDAEETEAFAGPSHSEVIMRVGGALVRIHGNGLPADFNYEEFAAFQLDRIEKTADGENPDV